jgi:hypothetical protein
MTTLEVLWRRLDERVGELDELAELPVYDGATRVFELQVKMAFDDLLDVLEWLHPELREALRKEAQQ